MKTISRILIITGIVFGLLGLRSYWRDYTFKKASSVVQASVISVNVTPIRSGLSSIQYSLGYSRDGMNDTLHHTITEAYTTLHPLPTLSQLKSESFYIHYVPENKRNETSFPYRTHVNKNGIYGGFYNRALFGQMVAFILLGYMVRMFGKKQTVSNRLVSNET